MSVNCTPQASYERATSTAPAGPDTGAAALADALKHLSNMLEVPSCNFPVFHLDCAVGADIVAGLAAAANQRINFRYQRLDFHFFF